MHNQRDKARLTEVIKSLANVASPMESHLPRFHPADEHAFRARCHRAAILTNGMTGIPISVHHHHHHHRRAIAPLHPPLLMKFTFQSNRYQNPPPPHYNPATINNNFIPLCVYVRILLIIPEDGRDQSTKRRQ